MTTLQLLIICSTVLALAAILRRPNGGGADDELPEGDLVVHTLDGRSLRGAARRCSSGLKISDGSLLAGGEERGVGGDVVVPRSNIAWVQEL